MNTTTRVSLLALALGLGFTTVAGAQSTTPPTSTDANSNMMHALPDGQVSSNAPAAQSKTPPPHPGDRNCLQTTGSLIPAKPGHCLALPGSSYSRQDVLNTGRPDTGVALRDLDPRITLSGGH